MPIKNWTPEQIAKRRAAQKRWYEANKDWVNPKRYATWRAKHPKKQLLRAA